MASNKSSIVRVGMIGLGTVGIGVARILKEKRDALKLRTGFDFELKTVCVRSVGKRRGIRLGATRLTRNPLDILNDPDIDQVVELIGGIQPAYRLIATALKNGKDVISANKALFAERGKSLYALSSRTGRHIGLEASVAGGIPIIKALKEGLASNRVTAIYGILNGTCNLILSEMSQNRRPYAEALADAQARGFAEKNPLLDVNGADTAHKLAILARIAFQREIPFCEIHFEGIRGLSPVDIAYANEMGYSVKLLAIAKRAGNELELRVHPTLLDRGHLLANVNGVNNAVLVRGDEVEDVLFYGKGAGQRPTASAVLSDMIDIAKLRREGARATSRGLELARVEDVRNIESRYYLRFDARDKTGVLGRLTMILGNHGISISSVHQMEVPHSRAVPVIILTHRAKESRLEDAVRTIDRSPLVTQKTVVIRVED